MYNGNNLSIIFSSNNRIIINSTKKLDNWPFTDVSCTTRTMQIDPLVYSINGGSKTLSFRGAHPLHCLHVLASGTTMPPRYLAG